MPSMRRAMTGKPEIERKYDINDGFRVPDLTGVSGVAQVGAPDEHRLDASYFDTPGLDLIRNKITLRRRTGGTDAGWHLKQPAGTADRTETQAPLGDDDQPPAEILDLIRGLVQGQPLRLAARIRTRRLEQPILGADGTVLALLADDTVISEAPGDRFVVQRWRELEVELVDGQRSVLDAIEDVLRTAGARPADSQSKLARALDHRLSPDDGAGPPAPEQPPGQAPEPARRETPLTTYLWAQHDAIVANVAGVRDADVEAVHDMRVATRRVRSTLRTFAPVLDAALTDGLDEELKWLAAELGQVRDGDVLADRLAVAVSQLPPELVVGPVAESIRQRLTAHTASARDNLVAGLDSDRYAALISSLAALAERGEVSGTDPARLRRLARKAVRRADRRLAAADQVPTADEVPETADQPTDAPATRDERLHDARKAYKRARYAVEVVALDGGEPAGRLVRRLRALQEVLGTHQDATTAANRLLALAAQAHLDGENAFTYGVLHAHQLQAGRRSLDDLPEARRRASRPAVRDWLDS
jgi:CHAD domain-containing protein